MIHWFPFNDFHWLVTPGAITCVHTEIIRSGLVNEFDISVTRTERMATYAKLLVMHKTVLQSSAAVRMFLVD